MEEVYANEEIDGNMENLNERFNATENIFDKIKPRQSSGLNEEHEHAFLFIFQVN